MEQIEPISPKARMPRFAIIGIGLLLLLSGVGSLIYAAVSQPTGTVVVTTYDVTGGIKNKLGGVTVAINSYKYDKECSDPIMSTSSAAGSDLGRVRFTGCPAKSTSKPRKYQKYVVVKFVKSGYQLSTKSPFKVGADKAASKGGSFVVRKNSKTYVDLYLEREGIAQVTFPHLPTPTIPPITDGGPGAATVVRPDFIPFSCGAVATNETMVRLVSLCNSTPYRGGNQI